MSMLYTQDYLPEQVFYKYSAMNAYIVPYSSDNFGGEKLSEYNLKTALNVLLEKVQDLAPCANLVVQELNDKYGVPVEVDQTTGAVEKQSAGLNSFLDASLHDSDNWKTIAFATGTASDSDFRLSLPSNSSSQLAISAGRALIYGYTVEATAEILIDTGDIMTLDDVRAVAQNPGQVPANPYATKFVKLVVIYAEGVNTRHDKRLVPPVQGIYGSLAVVINDSLPSHNELLLGTVTRDSNGVFTVVNNPMKSHLMPISAISGAEDYNNLIDATNTEENTIYGIERGEPGNLIPISDRLWLHELSNLAKVLKIVSVNPPTAGTEHDSNTRGIIVTASNQGGGAYNTALSVNQGANVAFPRLEWKQAYATQERGAVVEDRGIYAPFANTTAGTGLSKLLEYPPGVTPGSEGCTGKPYYLLDDLSTPLLANVSGTSGYMTPEQLFMLESLYADKNHPGRPFGPFLTVNDAVVWFKDRISSLSTPEERSQFLQPGDYFWVINDTVEAGGTQLTSGTTTYNIPQPIVTDYGSISGSVSGSVSGTVVGTVTGTTSVISGTTNLNDTPIAVTISTTEPPATYTGTGTITTGTTPTPVDLNESELSGVAQGNVSGTMTGTVTGNINSFSQNISSRYVCLTTDFLTEYTDYTPTVAKAVTWDASGKPTALSGVVGSGIVFFALEAVERGFAVPASSSTYGLVKIADSKSPEGVILDANNRLRVSDSLLTLAQNGGFMSSDFTVIELTPETSFTPYAYKQYDSLLIRLVGNASDWEANGEKNILSHVRGNITIDFTGIVVDSEYAGGVIATLDDIKTITLKGDNKPDDSSVAATAPLKFNIRNSVVAGRFFNNIVSWESSQFTSGSNTLELDNPWMRVSNIFTLGEQIKDNLYARFSSITMGNDGIASAMMDLWIEHEGWSNNNASIDRCWNSIKRINFPPLFFEFTELESGSVTTGSVNQHTIQKIPDTLSMKIGGTAGVHEIWNDSNSEYQVSGNLLATVDWGYNNNPEINATPAERLHLNLYMKNSSGDPSQRFSNIRFRIPVQIIKTSDNDFSGYADYTAIFQQTPEE